MNKKGFTVIELIQVVSIIGSLALIAGLLYVGWHFISKLW